MKGLVGRNIHTWNACTMGPNVDVCSKGSYLSAACRKFPVIVSKIVNLRLNLTRQWLQEWTSDQLKIVYLVRDPRATWHSRHYLEWCIEAEDCIQPKRLCDDIYNDLRALDFLSEEFPGRLLLIKYEDLARKPQETFTELFKFLNLEFFPSLKKIVEEHTKENKGGVGSTSRKSLERVDYWKKGLLRSEIAEVQKICYGVLLSLGYSIY
jgi:Sulfotransferase domain